MTLEVREVTLSLGSKRLVNSINFMVEPGQIYTIMGASGCGKSSLLGFIAGTLSSAFGTSGNILINGKNVTGKPAHQRRIGMQFQEHLLFPHMTVGENLAFGIPSRYRRKERQEMVIRALSDCGLPDYSDTNPASLSGGQEARISLMRTLLSEPAVLLMDEPFSKLDSDLQQDFSSFIYQHVRERNIMAVLVTHNTQDIYDERQLLRL